VEEYSLWWASGTYLGTWNGSIGLPKPEFIVFKAGRPVRSPPPSVRPGLIAFLPYVFVGYRQRFLSLALPPAPVG
jgi:hypothetical protein